MIILNLHIKVFLLYYYINFRTYLNNYFSDIIELKTIKGLALSDIITEIHNSYIHRSIYFYFKCLAKDGQ